MNIIPVVYSLPVPMYTTGGKNGDDQVPYRDQERQRVFYGSFCNTPSTPPPLTITRCNLDRRSRNVNPASASAGPILRERCFRAGFQMAPCSPRRSALHLKSRRRSTHKTFTSLQTSEFTVARQLRFFPLPEYSVRVHKIVTSNADTMSGM